MLLLSDGLFCLVREHWKQTLPVARVKLDPSGGHHDECCGGDVLRLLRHILPAQVMRAAAKVEGVDLRPRSLLAKSFRFSFLSAAPF